MMSTTTQLTNSPVEILIVEDSPTQAQQLQHILEHQGYHVRHAANGRPALEAAKQRRPDLIISDVVMPEMDGYELCRRLKAEAHLGKVPVILVTTLSDPGDVIRGLECGADNFILKPYEECFLLSRVQFVLLNREIQKTDHAGMGVEIFFNGQRHFITADRLQILNLLLSTYDAAIQRNKELSRTQEALERLNAKLEAANRAKALFMANMSHELRTPLNGIIGFAEFLVDGKPGLLNPKQKEYLGDILNSGRHLLQLINDVLDLSKVEAGKMELFPEKFSLPKAVDEACSIVSTLAMKKNITIRKEISPTIESVMLDPQKFKQVLYNLLSNAVKFTDDGGRVDIIAEPHNRSDFRLAIRDTGIGIKTQDLRRLFREFEQLDSGTERRFEGTGLGLALTRKIVELQGGTISVQSEAGKGSTFTVTLPRELREADKKTEGGREQAV